MTMLDSMRRHRGWLKWSLGLVVLTFALFFIPQDMLQPQTTAGVSSRAVVADVDGRELLAGEFQTRYLTQVNQFRQQFGGTINQSILRQLGVEQQVLSSMIDEQVALIEAERQGLRVSDEELAQQIFSIPGLQENGRFIGEERYEQLLQAQLPPMTKSQFEDSLRRSMMIEKLRAAVTDWMAVSDAELEREYRRRNEKVKLQVVTLTTDAFRDKVMVTDDEIAKYFESRKAEYRVGEQRTIKYLLLDRDQQRQKVVVPPADVQRFYNDNIQQYQTPEQVRASHILLNTAGKDEATVKKQADDLLAKVKAGADFAALAKQYSEDTASKVNGGDLDFFSRGRMVPEFEDAAFKLEPGQVSDVVKSQFGFHIIKVTEKRPGTTRTLDQVRQEIQQQLAAQIADQQLIDQAARLEDRLEDPGDLDTVAKELGLTVQESGAFGREDPVPGLGVAPPVASAAFQLADEAVSDAVASPRGPVFLTVTGKTDPYIPALDEVRERVRTDLVRSKAVELSRARGAEIATVLKSASSVADFNARATKQGFEVDTTELIARESPLPDVGINAEVDKVAFSLPVGGVSDPVPTPDGTVIVRVDAKDEVTADEFRQAKEAFRAELLSERRNRFFTAYMNKAKARIPVEIRQDTVQRIVSAMTVS
jgi:peptidyl-prolyl cis-trans isomerase D